jgi:hypothetical protein
MDCMNPGAKEQPLTLALSPYEGEREMATRGHITQGGARASLLRQKHYGGRALALGYCHAIPDGILVGDRVENEDENENEEEAIGQRNKFRCPIVEAEVRS